MASEKKFTVIASQNDQNIFYVRRGDGLNSNQDEATIVVFGRNGDPFPSQEALDFVEKAIEAKGYEEVMAEKERKATIT